MREKGTLTFFCGKMGAGKSTKSRMVAVQKNAVLLSEDHWLSSLYPNQISTFEDYLKLASLIKPLIKSHVQSILNTGTNVVMDFPANTKSQRQWFIHLCHDICASHELIYLNVDDQQCLKQIAQRRVEQPERASFDTEAVFYHVSSFFEPPQESENLNIVNL